MDFSIQDLGIQGLDIFGFRDSGTFVSIDFGIYRLRDLGIRKFWIRDHGIWDLLDLELRYLGFAICNLDFEFKGFGVYGFWI